MVQQKFDRGGLRANILLLLELIGSASANTATEIYFTLHYQQIGQRER